MGVRVILRNTSNTFFWSMGVVFFLASSSACAQIRWSRNESTLGQLALLQPLIKEAEIKAMSEAKKGHSCQAFTWSGELFPGYPMESLSLHTSCYITVNLIADQVGDTLSGLQLVFQPKAHSGVGWVPLEATDSGPAEQESPRAKKTLPGTAEDNQAGILSYVCTILPSEDTSHEVKPRLQALFAKLPGSMNSCVFSSDTY